MRPKNPVKERFTKSRVLGALALCVSVGFTVGFFSPGDIYLAGQADFFVAASSMLGVLLLTALSISCALAAVSMLFLLIGQRVFYVFRDLLTGLLCAMYVQMLFFNGGLGLMSGDGTAYSKMDASVFINMIVYFLTIFAPLLYHLYMADKTDADTLLKRCSRFSLGAAAVIFTLQLVGFAGMVITCRIDDRGAMGYLSYDEAMVLSKQNNVVVFLPDRLDVVYMDEQLEAFPEEKDIFEGFTYYRDNISQYMPTFPSVASMLSGSTYGGQTVGDFLDECWSGDNMMRTLKENGFRVNLILDGSATYHSISLLSGYTDTYKELDSGYTLNYLGTNGIVPTMTNLSLMKLSPYTIKSVFLGNLKTWRAQDFFVTDKEIPDKADITVSPESDMNFYKYIVGHSIRTDDSPGSFTFIHLNGAHDAYSDADTLIPEGISTDGCIKLTKVVRGGMEIIAEYLKEMKSAGIYDSSTIIVIGDHGVRPDAVSAPGDKLEDRVLTAVLIKEAGAVRKPLVTDSETPLSNEYFTASIAEYLGLDHSGYGLSYSDVIEKGMTGRRSLTLYKFNGANIRPRYICRYDIDSSALDFSNWKYVFEEDKK